MRQNAKQQESKHKQLAHWLRQYWVIGVAALLGAALWAGSPAWAAPVARPLNQTVPRPTPTSESNPVATATPRPGDGDDGGGGGGGGDSGQPDSPSGPVDNSDIFGQPAPGGGAAVTGHSATVDVATLNVRQGPGTTFPVVGSLRAGDTVTVTARNEDASWWYICCATDTGAQGWASAQLLTPSFDRAQAATLLPLFGTPPTPAAATPVAGNAAPPKAGAVLPEPLAVEFLLDPPFVWQGITGTLEIRISNPNTTAVNRAQLSDELPAALTLLDVSVDGGGKVERINTAAGRPLIVARWPTVAAGASVSALITFQVDSDLADGDVIDNLIAVRGTNAAYQTDAVTIGMPPLEPPLFE
ncbi:MAG: SH3 domain-containing protein [Caldilineaceae bacterium]|nr:SH3 domain-containing protein [Caldilineaceae bacterium]